MRRRARRRLGEWLLQAGLVGEAELRTALKEQGRVRTRLGALLIGRGLVDEEAVTVALAAQARLAPVHLDRAPLSRQAARWLSPALAERYRAIPLLADPRERLLTVATSEPARKTRDALARRTGMRVELVLAGDGALDRAIRRLYAGAAPPGVVVPLLPRAAAGPAGVRRGLNAWEQRVLVQGFALGELLGALEAQAWRTRSGISKRAGSPMSPTSSVRCQ